MTPDTVTIAVTDLEHLADKLLSLGWEYGQGMHTRAQAEHHAARYLREFAGIGA